MSIGEKFDDFSNWVTDGSAFSSFVKMLGVVSVAVGTLFGAVYGVVNYFSDRNVKSYNSLISEIDHTKSFIFASVEMCEAANLPKAQCEASRESAMEQAVSLGTEVQYDSMDECTRIHGNRCMKETTSMLVLAGKVPVLVPITEYKPAIVGWQASGRDLTKAVPLYAAPASAQAIRFDGKFINLAQQ